MTGLVAFSFALRAADQEPNPANIDLGDACAEIIARYPDIVVVAQWEIARRLEQLGITPALSVELNQDGSYLDSAGVWKAAKQLFNERDVTEVIPVAQPFGHLPLGVKPLIKDDGFKVINVKLPRIRFDNSPENTQWWTRGRLALITYFVMKKLGYKGGHNGQQYN